MRRMAENAHFKDIMRSKNCLIVVLFIVATSISIWLLSLPTPNLRNIMTQTHKRIENQIENLKNMNIENFNVMSRKELEDRDLTLDETYLELLGFTQTPHLYYHGYKDPQRKIPVIVTGATNKNYRTVFAVIDSVKKYMDGSEVVVFDLGMGSYELVSLKKHCNMTYNCSVRSLDFDKFPKHLKNRNIKAYLPILIQTALIEHASIVWISADTDRHFISSSISHVLSSANKTGIVAWTIDSKEPTSAYTHPKMFDYFKVDQEEYYFHRMVSTDQLIIFNTLDIHQNLMLPWVQCALTVECIYPKGAQNSGCNRQRKPKFLYSGCHKFEVSALNVILGDMFELVDDLYITNDQIFGLESDITTTVPYSKSISKPK